MKRILWILGVALFAVVAVAVVQGVRAESEEITLELVWAKLLVIQHQLDDLTDDVDDVADDVEDIADFCWDFYNQPD